MDLKELEYYIEQNRSALDVEVPPEEMWSDIERRLDGPKLFSLSKAMPVPIWKIAAVIVLALGVVLFLHKYMPVETARNMAGSFPTESIYQFSQEDFEELKQVKTYYKGKVEQYEEKFAKLEISGHLEADQFLVQLKGKKDKRELLENTLRLHPTDEHTLFQLVEIYKAEAEIWEDFFETSLVHE